MAVSIEAVLAQSEWLQRSRTLLDVVRVVEGGVQALTRFRSSWIAWFEDDGEHARIVAAAGLPASADWRRFPLVPCANDEMLAEIRVAGRPVVVEDARTDPRANPAMVARYGNRTIVHVPLTFGRTLRGALAAGSFGDEGVIVPTADELEALVVFASQVAPAFDRVTALEARDRAEAERSALQLHLESVQRVELVGLLAAGLAHDLNNLLTIALTSLDGLERHLVDGERDALRDATAALERMGELSGQILQLGRRDAGARQRVDLNDRVARTLALVRPSIPEAVEVSHVSRTRPQVDADPVQLEQLLLNLMVNARDAVGPSGSIALAVDDAVLGPAEAALVRGGRPGRFARVSVSDSGPGVPAELRERVFDPLYTTKTTGTGLGLAVVARITRQHQGFVVLDDQVRTGARFHLYLPAV